MDERQARLLIRQAFREQDLTVDVINAADAALHATLRRIASLIKTLPPAGDLLRERAWRKLKPQLMDELDGYANQLGQQTLAVLRDEIDQAEIVARAFLPTATPAAVSNLYERAIISSGVAGQSFMEVFGTSIDRTTGLLTVGQQRTGLSRFFVTSIDRIVMKGLLDGVDTKEMAHELVFDSIKGGLNLGRTGKQLRENAVTVVRTAIIEANSRAREEFWDANDEDIERWIYDALSDSRTCPWCAMNDQREEKDRDKLPKVPVHPRCRCQVLPLTKAALILREQDRKDGTLPGGSAVQLYAEDELPGKRKGESAKDFIQRKRREREAAVAAGKDMPERWYARPVKKDGKTYWKMARDLPASGKSGVLNVPQWLSTANKTTQIEFFGGGNAGAVRQKLFESYVNKGMDPREALSKLLSRDREAVRGQRPYRFIKKALLPSSPRD